MRASALGYLVSWFLKTVQLVSGDVTGKGRVHHMTSAVEGSWEERIEPSEIWEECHMEGISCRIDFV